MCCNYAVRGLVPVPAACIDAQSSAQIGFPLESFSKNPWMTVSSLLGCVESFHYLGKSDRCNKRGLNNYMATVYEKPKERKELKTFEVETKRFVFVISYPEYVDNPVRFYLAEIIIT